MSGLFLGFADASLSILACFFGADTYTFLFGVFRMTLLSLIRLVVTARSGGRHGVHCHQWCVSTQLFSDTRSCQSSPSRCVLSGSALHVASRRRQSGPTVSAGRWGVFFSWEGVVSCSFFIGLFFCFLLI